MSCVLGFTNTQRPFFTSLYIAIHLIRGTDRLLMELCQECIQHKMLDKLIKTLLNSAPSDNELYTTELPIALLLH